MQPGHKIENAFIHKFFDKLALNLEKYKSENVQLWREIVSILSCFDKVRFARYVAILQERDIKKLVLKSNNKLQHLIDKKFGCTTNPNIGSNVLNLSSHDLSPSELMVLDHGLDFCIPLPNVKRKELFSEFEILNAQAERIAPVSETKTRDSKAKLNDLAHSYASTPVSHSEFKWRKEHFAVIKTLRQDPALVITRPDKGSGVVILNNHEYVDKMSVILDDKDKIEKLGPVATHDSTASLETKFQKKLVK